MGWALTSRINNAPFQHAQTFLQERDYGFVRLDGQMVRKARDDAMSRFETDPNCTVFLISLKCGSLGLNLTAASQVILVRWSLFAVACDDIPAEWASHLCGAAGRGGGRWGLGVAAADCKMDPWWNPVRALARKR